MNYYTHTSRDGTRTKSPAPTRESPNPPKQVQFGDDEPIALPAHGLDLHTAVQADGDVWAVVISATPADGPGLLIKRRSREIVTLPVVHGKRSVYVEEDGTVSYVLKGGRTLAYLDGRTSIDVDVRHPLAPDLTARDVWEGLEVVPQAPQDGWQLAEYGPGDRTLLLVRHEGRLWVAFEGFTPEPAKLTVLRDRSCVVSISLPRDEETFFVESKDFKPYTPIVETPQPIRIPDVRPCEHVMAMTWSDDPAEPEPDFGYATLQDPDGSRGGDTWKQAIDYAQSKRVPVVAYSDSLRFDRDLFEQFKSLVPAGMRVIPQQAFYFHVSKTSVIDTVASAAERLKAEAEWLSETFPDDWSINGQSYRMGDGTLVPLQMVVDLMAVTFDLALTHRCRWLRWYTHRRPWQLDRPVADGVLMFPELQTFARRLKASVPSRSQFPKQHAAPSVPQKPPMPTQPKFPLVSYPQFIDVEAHALEAQMRAIGGPLAASDMMHYGIRRLILGWTIDEIVRDVKHEPVSVPEQPWPAGVPSYARLVDVEAHEIQRVYAAAHGGNWPAMSDIWHNLWRRAVEKFTFEGVIAGIDPAAVIQVPQEPAASRPAVLKGQFMLDTRNPFSDPKWGLSRALRDRFFMAELDQLWLRDRPEADRVIAEYVAAGFNHVTAGPIFGYGYHGHFPDTDWRQNIEGFADYLEWLLSHGVEFTLMLLPDCEPYFHGTGRGWDMDLVRRDLTPLYTHPRIQALTKRTCLAWEQWASIAEMAKAFDWQRECFPKAERTWHNGPTHLCPGNSDESEEASWRSAAQHGVTGFLLQTSPLNDDMFKPAGKTDQGHTALDVLLYDLWDISRRFGLTSARGPKGEPAGNPWGRPVTQPDGSPLTLDYFEGMAFAMYWGDGDAETAAKWGEAASRIEGVRFCLDGAPK